MIIYNYPKELKPFYVRVNDDGKTAAAFDLIVPKVSFEHIVLDKIQRIQLHPFLNQESIICRSEL